MSKTCKHFLKKQAKEKDIAFELKHQANATVIFKLSKDDNTENCYPFNEPSDFGWCRTSNETVTWFILYKTFIKFYSRRTVGASAAIIAS